CRAVPSPAVDHRASADPARGPEDGVAPFYGQAAACAVSSGLDVRAPRCISSRWRHTWVARFAARARRVSTHSQRPTKKRTRKVEKKHDSCNSMGCKELE